MYIHRIRQNDINTTIYIFTFNFILDGSVPVNICPTIIGGSGNGGGIGTAAGGGGGGSTENDDEEDETTGGGGGGQQTDVAIHNGVAAAASGVGGAGAAVGAELELKSSENCLPNTLQVKFKSYFVNRFA